MLVTAYSSVDAAECRMTAEEIGQRISTVLGNTKQDKSGASPDSDPTLGFGLMLGYIELDSASRRRNWAWLEDQK